MTVWKKTLFELITGTMQKFTYFIKYLVKQKTKGQIIIIWLEVEPPLRQGGPPAPRWQSNPPGLLLRLQDEP